MRTVLHPCLSALTTLGLGGRAAVCLMPETEDDLLHLEEEAERFGGKLICLGGGSNILADDGELQLALVSCALLKEREVIGRDEDGSILVRVGSGTPLPRLLAWAAARGLSGLENLAGIPGTVGGAVAGNAGAMGTAMGDVLRSALIWSRISGLQRMDRQSFEIGYRHFALRGQKDFFVLVDAVLALRESRRDVIHQIMKEHVQRKCRVQPVREKTAGCVFKNPEGISAGLLLDRSGLRGYGFGGVKFSERHANFLVNSGMGTASAALDLLHEAREKVRNLFGVSLNLEVKLWCEDIHI
ncbi:MAG: UDP-N-acetylmuramate dehydrogenase [Desulfovibrionaceae bacterium]|nr:UDP-N-acetylmuramate dehydrogenase [Desulfovibrionaceae bacterium]